jgi:L-talarate/galactarate dehydratase
MKLLRLETDLLRVPLRRPVALSALQEPRPTSTVEVVLVRAVTDGPHTGLGFAYTLGGGAAAVRSLIDTVIADVVVGANPFDVEAHFLRASAHLDGIGFAGLAARAYAAVDFALWDLKAKAAGLPVHHLLGGYRRALKAVVSDTATAVIGSKQAIKESLAALDAGAAGV